jgi:hypothetical protein
VWVGGAMRVNGTAHPPGPSLRFRRNSTLKPHSRSSRLQRARHHRGAVTIAEHEIEKGARTDEGGAREIREMQLRERQQMLAMHDDLHSRRATTAGASEARRRMAKESRSSAGIIDLVARRQPALHVSGYLCVPTIEARRPHHPAEAGQVHRRPVVIGRRLSGGRSGAAAEWAVRER